MARSTLCVSGIFDILVQQHAMRDAARVAPAETCQEEGPKDGQVAATARSLGLPEFLGLLACGDDATLRVTALESVNRSVS